MPFEAEEYTFRVEATMRLSSTSLCSFLGSSLTRLASGGAANRHPAVLDNQSQQDPDSDSPVPAYFISKLASFEIVFTSLSYGSETNYGESD
jgi:hypothetical protein